MARLTGAETEDFANAMALDVDDPPYVPVGATLYLRIMQREAPEPRTGGVEGTGTIVDGVPPVMSWERDDDGLLIGSVPVTVEPGDHEIVVDVRWSTGETDTHRGRWIGGEREADGGE